MSADKNRSYGARFTSCAKKVPDDPYETDTATSGCACRNTAVISSSANWRSAAAATRTTGAVATGGASDRRHAPAGATDRIPARRRLTAAAPFNMITVDYSSD